MLANVTFECAQPPLNSRSLRRYELTTEDLRQLLEDKGGLFLRSHMATSAADSRRDFLNLIPLPPIIKVLIRVYITVHVFKAMFESLVTF